jgi:hypothetical protein
MTAPRVSIGMPIYNGEAYMAETIDSILGQTFGDFELIISDNASTDATEEIARRYVAEDRRVRYVRNAENVGAARNYNQLVGFAEADYFKWAGYDDILLPTNLERCVAALDADGGLAIAYPRTTIIDGDGEVVREHHDNLDMPAHDPVERVRGFAQRFTLCNPCFGVQRIAALRRTRLVQPFVSSDVPLLVEMAILGRWHEVPERLFLRRIHDTSSRQGQVTMAQVAAWFDPKRKTPVAPDTRMIAESERAIVRSDLPGPAKGRATGAFLSAWGLRRARVRGGRAKAALRARRAVPAAPEPV